MELNGSSAGRVCVCVSWQLIADQRRPKENPMREAARMRMQARESADIDYNK